MESKLQGKIIDYARDRVMVAEKVESKSRTGFPDVFLAAAGHVELWETKHPGKTGRLRPAQKRRIPELRAAGVTVRVIDDLKTAKAIIDDWGSDPTATGEH